MVGNDVDAQHTPRLGRRRSCPRWNRRPARYEQPLGVQRPALLGGEVDACINAFTLANGAWLGTDVSGIAQWFLEHRMADGGWNCEWVDGSTRSSFHSTLNSLKGLLYYESVTGGSDGLRAARRAGEEYLLQRRLIHTLSTGELVGPWVTWFAYPFRWFYSALNAAEYFRAAALHDGTAPDPRIADAIEVIRAARRPDGTWVQERRHPGRVWFDVDVPPGEPSKWLTFSAHACSPGGTLEASAKRAQVTPSDNSLRDRKVGRARARVGVIRPVSATGS